MITVACPCPQTVRARTIYYIPEQSPQVRNTPEPWPAHSSPVTPIPVHAAAR